MKDQHEIPGGVTLLQKLVAYSNSKGVILYIHQYTYLMWWMKPDKCY